MTSGGARVRWPGGEIEARDLDEVQEIFEREQARALGLVGLRLLEVPALTGLEADAVHRLGRELAPRLWKLADER